MNLFWRLIFALLPEGIFLLAVQEPVPREFPPETIEKMQRDLRGKLREEYRPDLVRKYLPYLHPTIQEPVGDGLVLDVPSGLGNPEAARWGFLDVTAAPFRADPTGREDSTAALQKAVDFARDRQMVCFFPPGTYRVSDTLTCTQNYYLRANGAIVPAPQFPCVLVGSTRDPARRAKIFLAPRSPGFGDPARRKFVVHFTNRALPPADPSLPQANISFNQVFCSIDIEIGEGNPGAVGLRMQAAEGSSVQDSTIDATHGFIGMQGAAGSGGSHHGITIVGGRIGIDTHGFPPEFTLESTGTQPTPTLAGITLVGQTEAALVCKSRGPLVGVGWRIVARGKGPVLRVEKDGPWAPFNGSLALIDSEVVFENPSVENTVLATGRSVTLNDVYLKNAGRVFEGCPARPDGWFHIREMAFPRPPGKVRTYLLEEPVYVDGRRLPGMHLEAAPGEAPPPDLQSRHLWGPRFPSWESPGAANVREPPYGARGDGRADDTAAIQKAIDGNEIVFLPKGIYRLTRPLVLRGKTKLMGAGQHLSLLMARDPEGPLADPERPAPLVDTPDDAGAETVLAFLGIRVFPQVRSEATPSETLGHYALRWRCGRGSVFRTVAIEPSRLYGFAPLPSGVRTCTLRHPLVRISGNGGGKWYNFFVAGHFPCSPGYRHLLIEDKGDEPLSFYHLHAQYADSEAQCEMRRARNVDVFGVKTEYHASRFLIARDSRDLRIFGHGGNAKAAPGSAHYLFENVSDFLISNLGDQVWLGKTEPPPKDRVVLAVNRNLEEYFPFVDAPAGAPAIRIPPLERPILYRRGTPRRGG